jgi:hypothetical protein
MMMIAVSLLLSRALAYALIAVSVGKKFVTLAVVSEVGLFFLYKLGRRDFLYFGVKLSGFLSIVAAILERFVMKIVTDFTCLMVARNPCELGGLYFSVNALMSQVLLWGSIMLYIEKMGVTNDDDDDGNDDTSINVDAEVLSEDLLYSIGQAISSVWVAAVAVFFMTCNKEYIKTFVGTATAKTYTKECFDWQMQQEPRSDEAIVKIFKRRQDAYKHFESEVGAFVNENWERWSHEKPKFFTKKFIASIPVELLTEEIRSELMVGYENDEREAENE